MYDIELTEFGYAVTNDRGDIIMMADTEEEAQEFMDSYKPEIKDADVKISPYKQFDIYTQKLKGKCWPIDGKFGTIYEKPLGSFAKSFEKNTGYKVKIDCQYLGGEWIFIVDEVE